MRRGPTHRSGTHRIELRLGPDARALVDAVREADAPSTDDKARVRRALFAALAAGAATTASAATASAAVGASTSAASTGVASTSAAAGASAMTSSVATTTAAMSSTAASGAALGGTALGITSTGAALTKFAAIAVASAAFATVIAVGPSAFPRALPEAPMAAQVQAPAVLQPPRHSAAELPLARSHLDPAAPSQLEPATHGTSIVEPPAVLEARSITTSPPRPATPRLRREASLRSAPPSAALETEGSVEAAAREPASPAASLSEETAVLRAAWREIRFGDAASALARLDAHRARFPSGVLVPERDAARVIALCADGQVVQGRRAAAQFAVQHSGSPLDARVRAACE